MPVKNSKLKVQSRNLKLKVLFKSLNFAFCIITLHFALYTLHLPPALAATMTNDNYSVDKQSVQIQPFVTEPPKPKEVTEEHLSSGDNYTVNTTLDGPFSFSLSQNTISFGEIQPTNPVIRDLVVRLTSFGGYQILTAANHPLQKQNGIFIPDTTCDNGSCSEFTAAPWLNTLTYGFGYQTTRMEENYYKQFADILRNEAFQAISSGTKAQNIEEKVTLRINTSGTQETGAYTNTIFYIATPDF